MTALAPIQHWFFEQGFADPHHWNQAFLFACAGYPVDAETAAEIEAEAREAIARLASHPSLAIWNGGNETIWGWFDWGWPERIGDRPWGLGYWPDLLPRLVVARIVRMGP